MNVLIPLDDAPTAKSVIDFLGKLNYGEHSTVRIIHVMNPIMVNEHPPIAYSPFLEPAARSYRAEAEEMVKDAAKRLHSKWRHNCVINVDVIVGLPEKVIEQEAAGWPADLIVMGSHAESDVKKFFLGSVSRDIVAHVPCSVMVVRST